MTKNLMGKTRDLFTKCEGFMDQTFKASGMSVIDAMSGLNAETGAMIGGCVEFYSETKSLAFAQAEAMDSIIESLDGLKAQNELLKEQNKELRCMLQDLSRRVSKPGEE